jgi:hypothetical protein
LRWDYPVPAHFFIYKKEQGKWVEVGSTKELIYKIPNHPIVDALFKVSVFTEKGERGDSFAIYLTSKKPIVPGGLKALTGVTGDAIVKSPTNFKLYGVVKP